MSAFRSLMQEQLPPGEADLLLAALDTPSPVSIRLNPRKTANVFPGTEEIPWCPNGRYLSKRPSFTADPLFHAGAYYVQEASGMAIWQLKPYLQNINAPRVLDACAAPGGKSTLLLDIMPEDGLLVSNEIIRSRVPVLAENLAKWGYSNVVVTQNDPASFAGLPGYFDLITVDAPCSGEGMFRKDPGARNEWSPAHVELCAQRQRRILADLWPALKPGGLLLYSTCTFNRKEDEDQVAWMCDTLGANLVLGPQKYMPHQVRGEGFFMALVAKPEGASVTFRFPAVRQSPAPGNHPLWLFDGFSYAMKGPILKAYPKALHTAMRSLENVLNAVHSGIAVATQKGNDWVPTADLALARDLNPEAFPRFAASLEQALTFLRRDALVLPPETDRGYILITFEGLPLGFVKNLGSRTNNLYPPARRIINYMGLTGTQISTMNNPF